MKVTGEGVVVGFLFFVYSMLWVGFLLSGGELKVVWGIFFYAFTVGIIVGASVLVYENRDKIAEWINENRNKR